MKGWREKERKWKWKGGREMKGGRERRRKNRRKERR